MVKTPDPAVGDPEVTLSKANAEQLADEITVE